MFNFIRKILKKDETNLVIKREFRKDGICFSIYKEKKDEKEKLKLPINYRKHFDLKKLNNKDFYFNLQVLDELWNSGLLEERKNKDYFIKTEVLYNKENELLSFLEIESDENIRIEINSKSAVGTSSFSLNYNIFHSAENYISNFYDRKGSFFPINNKKAILLSKDLTKLLKLVENYPNNRSEQMIHIAKIKSLGNKLKVKFDDYLENEEYYFPEELDAEIIDKDIDHLELKPKFNDLDEELNKEVEKSIVKNNNYAKKKDFKGRNKRVFLNEDRKKDYQKIKANQRLKGSNVAKFIENPATFLPESVDLEKFSERVKGLKERVYQAQPYVHSKETEDINWFEIDMGFSLESLSEEENSNIDSNNSKLDIDDFAKIVEQAREKNEEYILWDNKWVKIPENANDFIEDSKEIEKLVKDSKISKGNMPYVFDIYENIDRLEYNLTLIKLKERLDQVGALKYQRPKFLKEECNLYDHQKEGYIWLNRLKSASLGGLLADDMGLGKTLQVIALMLKLKESNTLTPSLIVAPATLLENWKEEIRKFAPIIKKVYIHRGGKRSKDSEKIRMSEVVLTTYATLARDQLILGEMDWQLIACDEAQNIKNKSTLAAHAIKAQKAKIRLALTGTPVENGLSDLWSIMDYVQPGLLNSYKQFKEEFIKPIEDEDLNLDLRKEEIKLKRKINPVYLRRTKEGELKDKLPRKIEEVEKIKMSEVQKEIYRRIVSQAKASKNNNFLSFLQKLIMLCSHPYLVQGDWKNKDSKNLISSGTKLKLVLKRMDKANKKGEKVLIFTIYREMQYILQRVITQKFELNKVPIINGDSKRRVKAVDDFNKKEGFGVMILSPKAAGTGLNITGANHVIHYTRWWNPAVEQQATDRAYRIGQERDVYVYYPIVTANKFKTVEENLAKLLSKKKDLAKNIIIPNKKLEKQIEESLGRKTVSRFSE